MCTICGADCSSCNFKENCKGCLSTDGHPFGGNCIAAEYIKTGGKDAFEEFKKTIIAEFNELGIEGMPKITELYCLCGFFVNMEYPMPNGDKVKLLDDKNIYLGTQVISELGDGSRCYGMVAGTDFLLVCEYGPNGDNPEIVVYKRR